MAAACASALAIVALLLPNLVHATPSYAAQNEDVARIGVPAIGDVAAYPGGFPSYSFDGPSQSLRMDGTTVDAYQVRLSSPDADGSARSVAVNAHDLHTIATTIECALRVDGGCTNWQRTWFNEGVPGLFGAGLFLAAERQIGESFTIPACRFCEGALTVNVLPPAVDSPAGTAFVAVYERVPRDKFSWDDLPQRAHFGSAHPFALRFETVDGFDVDLVSIERSGSTWAPGAPLAELRAPLAVEPTDDGWPAEGPAWGDMPSLADVRARLHDAPRGPPVTVALWPETTTATLEPPLMPLRFEQHDWVFEVIERDGETGRKIRFEGRHPVPFVNLVERDWTMTETRVSPDAPPGCLSQAVPLGDAVRFAATGLPYLTSVTGWLLASPDVCARQVMTVIGTYYQHDASWLASAEQVDVDLATGLLVGAQYPGT